jgi:catechol 2,3-dioxygenase
LDAGEAVADHSQQAAIRGGQMSRRLIAHLAHVEIHTPSIEQSLAFFVNVLGLEETTRAGQSVYLRGWGEWSHHSLQLTEGDAPGLGHIGWRAWSADDLSAAAQRLESEGAALGWVSDCVGHGPALRFRSPGGRQIHELFWETEHYSAPAGMESPFPSRPQRYLPKGIAPRQIDHVTVMSEDPFGDAQWMRRTLGSTFTEYTMLDEQSELVVFAMSTFNEKSHDLGLILDQSGVPGRLHHVAWWVDSRDELLRAADILLNSGTPIEFGPGRHGMGEQDYLYFREPGGVRFEINTGGYRLYVPDWEPKRWVPSQGSNTFYRNVAMPDSMMEAFPPAALGEDADPDAANPWSAASVH